MQIRQIERTLTRELKKKFDQTPPQKFDKVYIFKRPFQSSRIKKKWNEMNRPANITRELTPPLQPEIDMILCKEDKMIGVEIKYFEMKGNSLSRSFYEGIEQTLALLRWGFDHVALWQLFEESVGAEELFFYGVWTWNFLHATPEQEGIGLPIEFTMMRVRKSETEYDFHPMRPERDNGRFRLVVLRPPYDPQFRITLLRPNPLVNSEQAKRLRSILLDWLKTQKT
jgi:hypothetical protein